MRMMETTRDPTVLGQGEPGALLVINNGCSALACNDALRDSISLVQSDVASSLGVRTVIRRSTGGRAAH